GHGVREAPDAKPPGAARASRSHAPDDCGTPGRDGCTRSFSPCTQRYRPSPGRTAAARPRAPVRPATVARLTGMSSRKERRLRNLRTVIAGACAVASAGAFAADAPASCQARSPATLTPVIELYTSEGCSSCPPADRWLSSFKEDAAKGRVVA